MGIFGRKKEMSERMIEETFPTKRKRVITKHGITKYEPYSIVMTPEYREVLRQCKTLRDEGKLSPDEREKCKKMLEWAEEPEQYRK